MSNFFQRIPDEIVIQAYNASNSISECIATLGKKNWGGNRELLQRRFTELNLSWSDLAKKGSAFAEATFSDRSGLLKGKTLSGDFTSIPNDLFFRENSTIYRHQIRSRILKQNLLPYVCALNGCTSEWFGKPLVLVLDHINGVSNDHRLENLRFLCPNCNSQTETFCGRNIKIENKLHRKVRIKKEKKNSVLIPCECGNSKSRKAKTCLDCFYRAKAKIAWPDAVELEKMVWAVVTSTLCKTLGVSDKAIDQKCKKYGISKPPRGYWAIVHSGGTKEELIEHCAKHNVNYCGP